MDPMEVWMEAVVWCFIYAGMFISVALLAVILHVIFKGDK